MVVKGTTGNDTLAGTKGADTIYGFAGNDAITGDDGNDCLDGGDGNDTLDGGAGNDTLIGGEGNNLILSGDGIDSITSGSGNDNINGYLTDSTKQLGAYTYRSASGSKTISTGAGDDFIYGSTDADHVDGGAGNDAIYGNSGDDILVGRIGNDYLNAGDGNDSLDGGDGNDTLDGGVGNDYLDGGSGNNFLEGGAGNDSIYGGLGYDTYIGGDGNDYLADTGGNNYFDAGAGNDTVYGDSGNDSVIAGDGNDYVLGWTGDDSISGGSGDDYLSGGAGNDTLDGGTGADSIFGGAGNDTLIGGTGGDNLDGGLGNDTYYVDSQFDYIVDDGGVDTAYVSKSFVKIPNTIENVHYVNGAQALPYWIDALLPDESAGLNFLSLLGATKTYSYTFASSIPKYDLSVDDAKGWAGLTSTQQIRVRAALTYISSVIDLNFAQTLEADAPNTINFANNTQTGSAGYAQYPNVASFGSDVFLNNSLTSPENAALKDGTYGALTLIHELGHALGLEHPFEAYKGDKSNGGVYPFLTGSEDSTTWTVMSYNSSNAQYHLSYSPLDIAALQYLYGPSATARTTDDTYQVSASTSNFIWDGAGKDTLTLASVSKGATIYLTPGYWGYVGNKSSLITDAGQVTVNFGTTIEQLIGSSYADSLNGNEANNTIDGGAGNDSIEGWDGDDSLIGGLGADTLIGGIGDDSIDGGVGIDTVSYSGILSNYTIIRGNSNVTVSARADGLDTLVSVERLKFSDSTIALDIDGIAGQCYRIYKAAFARTPDLGGVGYWISVMDKGTSLQSVAGGFIDSAEFKSVYGTNPTNDALVTKFYTNVLGRAPDATGAAYWSGVLNNKQDTVANVLVNISESTENKSSLVGVIGNGFEYTPYG